MREGDKTNAVTSLPQSVRVLAGVEFHLLGTIECAGAITTAET